MPLRSVMMKRFIFGFQRRVWCPKWTPLSRSWRMVTTAMPCLLVSLSVASVCRIGAATCLAPATHPTGILTGLLWCAPVSSASRVNERKTREVGLRVRAHVDRRPSYVLSGQPAKSADAPSRALGWPVVSAVSRVVDRIAPPRLGRGFRWLLASSWVSNTGDGIALAAGPLLVAPQTRNAVLVALAAVLQRLPWLLFGLWAGALADRLDRRRVVIVADLLRAVVVAALSVTIVTGQVSIGLVLGTMFVYGVAEVFADTTTGTLLPMLVDKPDLGLGNARIQAGFLTANQLVGPPIGALLFAAGMVWPFVVQV